jgi:hypothetical protein
MSWLPLNANDATRFVVYEVFTGLEGDHVRVGVGVPKSVGEHRRSHENGPARAAAFIFEIWHAVSGQDNSLMATI